MNALEPIEAIARTSRVETIDPDLFMIVASAVSTSRSANRSSSCPSVNPMNVPP
jgi:hypothetical protein